MESIILSIAIFIGVLLGTSVGTLAEWSGVLRWCSVVVALVLTLVLAVVVALVLELVLAVVVALSDVDAGSGSSTSLGAVVA
ncbi:BEM_collapsed_G0028890.mRNA.1.CDS.1 [Saccharomyces cerevisiae]|nr:BEM_collapsed_G0028890.mRNA.1.CDS.1 [Saccharomyces cerevisiae]